MDEHMKPHLDGPKLNKDKENKNEEKEEENENFKVTGPTVFDKTQKSIGMGQIAKIELQIYKLQRKKEELIKNMIQTHK